jgi:predicted transcriptional regulator
MTLQLTAALEQRLAHLAAEVHRSPDELAQEAVDRFLTYNEELSAAVEIGRAAAARGEMVDHEEVMTMVDDIILNG